MTNVWPSRVMTCNSCGEEVEVFEAPVPFTDPARFTCVQCLDPRHRPLELAVDGPRTETRRYDPATAQIPF